MDDGFTAPLLDNICDKIELYCPDLLPAGLLSWKRACHTHGHVVKGGPQGRLS